MILVVQKHLLNEGLRRAFQSFREKFCQRVLVLLHKVGDFVRNISSEVLHNKEVRVALLGEEGLLAVAERLVVFANQFRI